MNSILAAFVGFRAWQAMDYIVSFIQFHCVSRSDMWRSDQVYSSHLVLWQNFRFFVFGVISWSTLCTKLHSHTSHHANGFCIFKYNLFFFQTVDCLDPTCSSHGVCIHGECHCNPGWGGNNCEIMKTMCADQCSGHGTYQTESGTCTCDANWTGPDCSIGITYFLFFL